MSITEISVKRPVATIMFFLGIILLGIISLKNLSVDLLPSLSYPKITVVTEYPGALPEEIEKLITQPLEAKLSPISGVKNVKSVSREGVSIITVEFHWGTNMDFGLLHIKEKVEETSDTLPKGAKKPQIFEFDPSSRPIIIAVVKSKGRSIKEIRELSEFFIKPRFEQLEGISRVEVRGGGKQEILVKLFPEKLSLYGITFNEISNAINNYNQVILGGTIRKNKLKHSVKIEGEIKNFKAIEDIPVKKLKSGHIFIKDIGTVSLNEIPKQGDIRFDNDSTVALLIFKEADANTVKATKKAKEAFELMGKEFKDIRFNIITEEAGLILSSINSLKMSLYLGSILAFFVLLVFLQNSRDPLLVATVIPIAIISTFVLMYFSKVNINIMSLGGLALGVGMFVDNSIVVLESLFRHKKTKDAITAAIDGTKEVAGAITASTLTTIVIFIPVMYIYGITGRLFRDQALTVSYSLLASLMVSITLLPSLFAVFSRDKIEEKIEEEEIEKGNEILWISHFILAVFFKIVGGALDIIFRLIKFILSLILKGISILFNFIMKPIYKVFNKSYVNFDKKYHEFLEICLNRKTIPYSIMIIMFILSFLLYTGLKKELLPQTISNNFEISAKTSSDYGFEETDRMAEEIEKGINKIPEIEHIFTQVGAVSSISLGKGELSLNSIHMIVNASGNREKIMAQTRKILKRFSDLNYSVYPEKNTLSEYLRFGAEEFQIQVFYDRIEYGKKGVESIIEKLKGIKGLVDLRSNIEKGKPVLALSFNESILKNLNITKKDISTLISNALKGEKVSVLKQFQKNYDIVLSTPLRKSRSFTALLKMPVKFDNNIYHISDFIQTKRVSSIKEITREGQERYFLISANLYKRKLSDIAGDVDNRLLKFVPPVGTRFRVSGEEEERKKAFTSIKEAIFLAALLVYMVMASQFENLIHPLIIMLTLPMGFLGAFLFLFIAGSTINVIAGIGFLVMVGIVVNDAIVKIDYTNKLRQGGKSVREALMIASKVRLTPILMPTFTTIFGLIPMALMTQEGSELQRPLAIVVVGGLLFSTFLTLILIPVLYESIEKKDKISDIGEKIIEKNN
jgi:HAE1 family hydrophobic/amphiphilic exporter-1